MACTDDINGTLRCRRLAQASDSSGRGCGERRGTTRAEPLDDQFYEAASWCVKRDLPVTRENWQKYLLTKQPPVVP